MEDIGLENTQQYDLYKDETRNKQLFPQPAEELEPTPDVGDLYIEADILLPKGNEMARGHVVVQSCDINRNVMCRAYINPILDTRMY